jgi:MFS family permease
MASVWGAMQGLSFSQIAAFGATLYLGGLVLQYPIGWASDRVDRRALIMGLSAVGAVLMTFASFVPLPFTLILGVALLLGGIINPLYSLLIALTNDYLSKKDMPGASAGLIFLNGFGAIFGPLLSGWFMAQIGAGGYFLFLGLLFAVLAGYAAWRITRRSGPVEQASFTGLSPTASSLAVGAVMEQEPRNRRPT